jgi:hypothetical protein
MKLLFNSLDALLNELRECKVSIVRISPAIERETGVGTGGIPHLTSRVIVTAAIDGHLWAEWRYWVGRAVAEISEHGLHLPGLLQRKSDEAATVIARSVDNASFEIREGILAHDTAAIDTFSLPAASEPLISNARTGTGQEASDDEIAEGQADRRVARAGSAPACELQGGARARGVDPPPGGAARPGSPRAQGHAERL